MAANGYLPNTPSYSSSWPFNEVESLMEEKIWPLLNTGWKFGDPILMALTES
jgi:hypothetical protein